MYNGFSIFSTTRHVSRNTEPGFKYFSEGPLISARASAEEKINKIQFNLKCDWSTNCSSKYLLSSFIQIPVKKIFPTETMDSVNFWLDPIFAFGALNLTAVVGRSEAI